MGAAIGATAGAVGSVAQKGESIQVPSEPDLVHPAAEGIPSSTLLEGQSLERTWLLENTHPGQIHFALEDDDGRPSPWNTL